MLASEAAYVARFGEREWLDLTDTERSGQPDADRVASAIADTQAEVSRYLSQAGYVAALQNPSPELTRRALDVTRYLLHSNRPTQEVRQRYEDAVKWLGMLVSGEVALFSADGSAIERESTKRETTRRMAYGKRRVGQWERRYS